MYTITLEAREGEYYAFVKGPKNAVPIYIGPFQSERLAYEAAKYRVQLRWRK